MWLEEYPNLHYEEGEGIIAPGSEKLAGRLLQATEELVHH